MLLKPQIGPIPHTHIATDHSRNSDKKNDPMFSLVRSCVAAVFAVSCVFAVLPAMAQGTDAKPADKPGDKPAGQTTDADAQRRVDEFAEAARQVSGPAGNAECVWLGRNVVGLLWRNDMDTAFRHLDLYDRFGCPGGHVQASFRCLTRFGSQIDDKVPRSLSDRIQVCWINPGAQPQAAVAATPAPAPTTAGNAAPAPASSPAPAAK